MNHSRHIFLELLASCVMVIGMMSCEENKTHRHVVQINKDSLYMAINARQGYKDTLFTAIDSLYEYYQNYEGGRGRSIANNFQNLNDSEHNKPKDVKKQGKDKIKPVSVVTETLLKGQDSTEAMHDSLMTASSRTSLSGGNAKGDFSNSSHGEGEHQTGTGGYQLRDYDKWNDTEDDYNKDSDHQMYRWEVGGDAAHLFVGSFNAFGGYRTCKRQQLSLELTGAWFGSNSRHWLHRFLIAKASYAFYFKQKGLGGLLSEHKRLKGFHVGPYLMYGHYQLLRASWDKRWVGNFLSTGVDIGYRFNLPLRWSMDLNLSLGYLYSPFHNAERINGQYIHTYDGTTNYFGPTDFNIKLAKTLNAGKKKKNCLSSSHRVSH